jgi:predicted ATP-dependent endonuclease of OLD family
MLLKKAHIVNFRSLRDVTVSFGKQTAILGGNGTGKSTIIKAIERFYGPSTNVSADDFFGKDVDNPIEIGLTFTDFSEGELEAFASRIVENEMNVVRVFDLKGGKTSGKYYGFIKGHTAFEAIRNTEAQTPKKSAYNELRDSNNALYHNLPAVSKGSEIEAQLVEWERRHEGQCSVIRDDGQFLGFTNVAKGSLSKSTSFVFIPAVRDAAADAIDKGGTAIARLMELVVKSAVQRRKDFQAWQEKTSSEYKALVSPENLEELGNLATELTTSLKILYEDTAVSLEWQPAAGFEIPLPGAKVSLEDGGFQSTVEKQGNGLQRAFILTLLQHLARATVLNAQSQEQADEQLVADVEQNPLRGVIPEIRGVPEPQALIPGLILAIEEPELYQHPTKQRHFARVLSQLSDGSIQGVATNLQVIFASHSPYFVSTDRFDEVRLARRHPVSGLVHKECRLKESSLRKVCNLLEPAHGRPAGTFTETGLRSRLHIVTPELAEGFFADIVILVEGETDRAALKATAAIKNVDLEALGIAVLPVGGKNNLDRPAAVFQSLEIPVYGIWDCDQEAAGSKGADTNRALQRLFGSGEAEIVDNLTRIADYYACFEGNLEKTLQQELGAEAFAAALGTAKHQFSVEQNQDAIKSPAIMQLTLSTLAVQNLHSPSLESIIERVCELKARISTIPEQIIE